MNPPRPSWRDLLTIVTYITPFALSFFVFLSDQNMKNVVFVAPYFMDTTERFIYAATKIPDARIGLVSCDPIEKLDPKINDRLAGHYQVEGISTGQLQRGVEALATHFGSVDRLIGVLEQIQVSLGQIRDNMKIHGMGANAAICFRDKSTMKTVLQSSGLPCAGHQLIDNKADANVFMKKVGFPIIVKPPDGAGAKGTYRCENEHQLKQCLDSLNPEPQNPILLEEFITGQEFSFDSVMLNGSLVWHSISQYSPSPLEVVQQPWIQWCVMIPRHTIDERFDEIKRVAGPALQALGLGTGLSHMEWFRKPDGSIAISEVGARPPGAQFMTLMSYAHDIDMYHAWTELMIHDRFDARERRYACGAAYLRGMGMGRVKQIEGIDEIAKEIGDIVVEHKLPEIGQAPTNSYEGEGFIIVRHPETDIVESALKKIITEIQVRLAEPQLA